MTQLLKKILLTGATSRKDGATLGDGKLYDCAKLIELDTETCRTKTLIEKNEGGKNYPDIHPNLEFTASTLVNDELFLCTDTEVFVYEYPSLTLKRKTSHPYFQNIHHVAPHGDVIAVTSTGIDSVILLDRETLAFKECIPVLNTNEYPDAPWDRYPKNTDFRKIHSTKPHRAHPNCTFSLNNEIWVTRFNMKNALPIRDLFNKNKKIQLGDVGIHDGHVIGDFIYFTNIKGNIFIINKDTLITEDIVDLNMIENIDVSLGWCRGIHIEDNIAYVGFSRLRNTNIKENIAWVKRKIKGKSELLNTRIAVYDLMKKEKIIEYILPKNSIDAIYSIIKGVQK